MSALNFLRHEIRYPRFWLSQALIMLLLGTWAFVNAQPVPGKVLFDGSKSPDFKNEGRILFAGGTNIANMRKDAFLETMLLAENPQKKLHIRNLGWDGDTVYEQFRDVGFGSWSGNIDSLGADLVFVQFGQMESLKGIKALDSFVMAYKKLLGEIKQDGRKMVLISPIPFEPGRLNISTENPLENAPVERYTQEIKKLATSEDYSFIDVYHPLKESANAGNLTTNGIHLNEEGQRLLTSVILKALHYHQDFSAKFEPLRQEVLTKNILWFNYWRPGNWAFLYGDRMTVPFSHDWTDKSKRIFPDEMKAFEGLMQEAENRILAEQAKSASVN